MKKIFNAILLSVAAIALLPRISVAAPAICEGLPPDVSSCGVVAPYNPGSFSESVCTISGRANYGGQTCNTWDSITGVKDANNDITFTKQRGFVPVQDVFGNPYYTYGLNFPNMSASVFFYPVDDNGSVSVGNDISYAYNGCTCGPNDVTKTGPNGEKICGGAGAYGWMQGTVTGGEEIKLTVTNSCKPNENMQSSITNAPWGGGSAQLILPEVTYCYSAKNLTSNNTGKDFLPLRPGVCGWANPCEIVSVTPATQQVDVDTNKNFSVSVITKNSDDQWQVTDLDKGITVGSATGNNSWNSSCPDANVTLHYRVSCSSGSSQDFNVVCKKNDKPPACSITMVTKSATGQDCTASSCTTDGDDAFTFSWDLSGGVPESCVGNFGSANKPTSLGPHSETATLSTPGNYYISCSNSTGQCSDSVSIGGAASATITFHDLPIQVCPPKSLGSGYITATTDVPFYVKVIASDGSSALMSGLEQAGDTYNSGQLNWVSNGMRFQIVKNDQSTVLAETTVVFTTEGCPKITPNDVTILKGSSQTFQITGSNTPFTVNISPASGVSPTNFTVANSGGTISSTFAEIGQYVVNVKDSKDNSVSAQVRVVQSQFPEGTACTSGSECASGCCSEGKCSLASACASTSGSGFNCLNGSCVDVSSGASFADMDSCLSACGGSGSACSGPDGYICNSQGSCVLNTTGAAAGVSYGDCLASCGEGDGLWWNLTPVGCSGPISSGTYDKLGDCLEAAHGAATGYATYNSAQKTCDFIASGGQFYAAIPDCEACNNVEYKYFCTINGTCQKSISGGLTESECLGTCHPATTSGYSCQNNSCVYVESGASYGTWNDCNANCCVSNGSNVSGLCCAGTQRCSDGYCRQSCPDGVTCAPTLSIFPSSASMEVGTTKQFAAKYDPDGLSCSQSPEDVTNSTTWTAGPAGTLSIPPASPKGTVRADGLGNNGVVNATYSNISASANVIVSASSISCVFSSDKVSITIPPPASVNLSWACVTGTGDPSPNTNCVITDGANFSQSGGSSGGIQLFPTTSTIYKLDCMNAGGKTDHQELNVKVRNINIIEVPPR